MGKGGSRLGAGRPGWRGKTEHCRSLDVRRFAAANMLRTGMWSWQWRDAVTGEEVASIGVIGQTYSIVLSYTAGGEAIRTRVPIVRTDCGFGGSRPWFACPSCSRRVALLFLRSKHFACRHCHRLSYGSQAADLCGRAWRRQRKIEARLGPNWQRPPHMHLKTYGRLLGAIMECERQRDVWLSGAVVRLMGGLEALQKRFPKLLDG